LGREIDGKNDKYERPILILKKINEEMFIGFPITSKHKYGEKFYQFHRKGYQYTVILTQIRIMSVKRLLRLVSRLDDDELGLIKLKLSSILT